MRNAAKRKGFRGVGIIRYILSAKVRKQMSRAVLSSSCMQAKMRSSCVSRGCKPVPARAERDSSLVRLADKGYLMSA